MKKNLVVLLVMSCFVLIIGQVNNRAALADVEAPAEPLAAADWASPQLISQDSPLTGAIQPAIAASATGSKIIVLYPGILNNDDDDHEIFYTISTDFGETWTTKGRVHNSPGDTANSVLVDVAISPNNKGHAVWVEEVGDVQRVVYKYEDNWANNATNMVTISSLPNTDGTIYGDPAIVAKANNRLDVVWAEYNFLTDSNPNIYHAYSKSNVGNPWQGKTRIAATAPSSVLPDIAIDASGNYHVVWEEGTTPSTIRYARGVPNGDAVTWQPSIVISNRSITDGTNAREPKIIADGNVLHVTYTYFKAQNEQFVHHLRCSAGCNTASNWVSANNPISGQVLGAKASEPLWLVSGLSQIGSCTFVYFHGIQVGNSVNERIWGVNSCNGWSAGVRDIVTNSNVRSIYPSMVSANNWWLFITYEQTNADGTNRKIYFVRNRPAIYLPTILK